MSIRYIKKEIQGSHYFSVFVLSNLLTQACLHFCTAGQLFFWTCKIYTAYIVYYYICFPLCAHILYFDAAKFSIKLFSFIDLTISVVRQCNEYEKVIETRPSKTIETKNSSPLQDVNLHKNLDNRAVVWLNKIPIR